MTDDEKAARVGKVWKPDGPSPDMLDPYNLIRAIETLNSRSLTVCISARHVIIHDMHGNNIAEATNDANIYVAIRDALARCYAAIEERP